ncbi:superoxide dismutase family protein [Legionella impletisoli]|uniref:Superoxide dismutase [Cu-Zn] n=1 Tax=Legionella impletisoli TaxID=343510 RepID=A0A917JUY9_9GAMM|nr:superoxide dismutase family protein [Legionella impletisoli]GGI86270.1 superoxide dismutase [Cu-Zn] [Legionella impletisoli]
MKKLVLALLVILFGNTCFSAEVTATVHSTEKDKKVLGQVVFKDTPYGLLIIPKLSGLPSGLHGFHLHEHPDCGDQGQAAGGHFDPKSTNTHQGPYGDGHLGDLPVLYVEQDGNASTPTLAPRLKTSDLNELALIIHEGGDTYSDTPKLGGGGARIACGVVNGKSVTKQSSN